MLELNYETRPKRKDPGPDEPALISPRRSGAYLRLRMEWWNNGILGIKIRNPLFTDTCLPSVA